MEKYGDGQKKMEGHCSTGQSSHRAVVPVEEEEGVPNCPNWFENCMYMYVYVYVIVCINKIRKRDREPQNTTWR
jgi:hypothetical protein